MTKIIRILSNDHIPWRYFVIFLPYILGVGEKTIHLAIAIIFKTITKSIGLP